MGLGLGLAGVGLSGVRVRFLGEVGVGVGVSGRGNSGWDGVRLARDLGGRKFHERNTAVAAKQRREPWHDDRCQPRMYVCMVYMIPHDA